MVTYSRSSGQAWNPVKLTAMHHQHISLGATMTDYGGWQRPSRYTSIEQELETVRKAGGLCDISPLGKYYIQGSDVDTFLQRVFHPEYQTGFLDNQVSGKNKLDAQGKKAASPGINGASLENLLGPDGSTTARVVVCRFSDDEVFVTSTSDTARPVVQALKEHVAGCAHMVDMTSNYAAVTVAGPMSGQLLAKLTDLDISPITFTDLSCAQGQVAEVYAIIVRWDQDGLPSYDVYFGRDFGEYMWQTMLEAGHEYGMAPFGIEALNRLSKRG